MQPCILTPARLPAPLPPYTLSPLRHPGPAPSYEELVSRLTEELNRFQKERAADTNALLRDLALTQARMGRAGGSGGGGAECVGCVLG